MQPSQPPDDLLAVAVEVTPAWLRRITAAAAVAGGVDSPEFEVALDALVETESARLLRHLADLLSTDVDQQRTNPLAVFRAAVAAPTDLLRSFAVPVPPIDPFGAERFPDDVYHLGPATFADIDERLRQPGLVWGAWKAMTILRRRQQEGVR